MMQGNALRYSITAACGSGFLLFGYDQGVFGGLLSNKAFLNTFNNPSATIQGQIVATYDIGCIMGTLLSIFFGDKLGRRRCIILIIGGILQAASYSLAPMIVGRIVAGVGNGMNTIAIPIWQSETSIATAVSWTFVYVVVTPTAIENIGWKYYLIYAVFNVCFVPIIYRWYVETANLSLEQVDRLFQIKHEGGKSISWAEASRLARMETQEEVEEKIRGAEHTEFAQTVEKK
ncbi:High-affinity glucose transporter [Lasiodiplodia theobromae]|uniref:High-affinity glucose transporter n=1 Tax=Lasiodiplodia theobromae TaxID=45133 RepID=A0A5N5CV83_9PEZI|nr:High-affinity glucose transporter [Lasiodiplodia theobromae]